MKQHNLIDPDTFETGEYKEDHFWDTPTWKEIALTAAIIILGIVGVITLL